MTTCPATRRRAQVTWLVRGAIGLSMLALAFWIREPIVVIPALIVALIAFRGCPMCWLFTAPSVHKDIP